jgi:hypothetical protein
MAAPRLTLTADERATVGKIVTRFPGLASAVHAQVTRLVDELAPAGDRTLTRRAEVDELLLKIVERVLARTKNRRRGAAREPAESVDGMVLLLARNSAARARPRLLEGLASPEANVSPARRAAERPKARRARRVH